MDELVYQKFTSNLNRPNLQNLHQLVISFITGDHSFVNIKTPVTNLPKLTELRLQRFVHSIRHLSTVAGNVTSLQLHKLNISHSSGIAGHLSVLMRTSFPFLTNLNLSDCRLNSNDLCSLAQASMDGKLPKLRYLDISENKDIIDRLESLFYKQCKWETIDTLNLEEINFKSEKDVELLARRMSSGYLRSLQKLKISSFRQESVFTRITDPLSNLRHIETNCDPQTIGEILRSISQAVEGDLLPVLETITMFLTSQKLPSTTQDIQLY